MTVYTLVDPGSLRACYERIAEMLQTGPDGSPPGPPGAKGKHKDKAAAAAAAAVAVTAPGTSRRFYPADRMLVRSILPADAAGPVASSSSRGSGSGSGGDASPTSGGGGHHGVTDTGGDGWGGMVVDDWPLTGFLSDALESTSSWSQLQPRPDSSRCALSRPLSSPYLAPYLIGRTPPGAPRAPYY